MDVFPVPPLPATAILTHKLWSFTFSFYQSTSVNYLNLSGFIPLEFCGLEKPLYFACLNINIYPLKGRIG